MSIFIKYSVALHNVGTADIAGKYREYSLVQSELIDFCFKCEILYLVISIDLKLLLLLLHFQINEETLNRRPIMQALPVTEKDINNKGEEKEEKTNKKLKTSSSTEEGENLVKHLKLCNICDSDIVV